MTRTAGRLLAATLALMLWVAPVAAQMTRYGDLDQAGKITAIEGFVYAGDYATAQRLLSNSYFDEGDLGYRAALLQARVWRATGRPDDAERLLRQILAERPAMTAARTELAGLLSQSGRARDARTQLEILRDATDTPGDRETFERLIDRTRAQSGVQFSGFASLLNDTNINQGTDAQIIRLFGLPFGIGANQRRSAGRGLRFGGSAVINQMLAPEWQVYGAGRLTVDDYEGGDFDRQIVDFRLGIRRAQGRLTYGIEALADRHWRGGHGSERALGLRLTGGFRPSARLLVSGEALRISRRYDDVPLARRETSGAKLRFDLTPRPARAFWLELERAEEEVAALPITSFDRRRVEVGAALDFGQLGTSLALSRTWDDYEAPFPGLAEPRDDTRDRAAISLWHGKVALSGFQPRLTVTATRQRSNTVLYDYSRVETGLSIERRF